MDMDKTETRAIVAAGVVVSAFALHLRQIPAEAELTAAMLLATAAGGGVAVGYTFAQREREALTDIRGTVARIREDQKRASRRFEVVDADELEDEA
ncbi:hypothetical protein BJ1_gp63 [Halorubrum virus BJ1]|uniref:Uncharacterized protein n=1 Tax=Halorubrum virus BJ1 TaxID=416419 RepID=A0ZYS6_9CAUD|nr:hypothetical protein BJ1_gp63 [Halorubrum virus BJ1]CAL92485.1 hypothetical protein [Halorubrum virus BJ1]